MSGGRQAIAPQTVSALFDRNGGGTIGWLALSKKHRMFLRLMGIPIPSFCP